MSSADGKAAKAAAKKKGEREKEKAPEIVHEQSVEDAYAEPTNFLEIEVNDPQNHGACETAQACSQQRWTLACP